MRVALFPSDRGACAHYRIEEPARVAALEGVEVEHCGIDLTVETRVYPGGRRTNVPADLDAEVYVISRPASVQNVSLVRWWKRQGHAVVVDVDDDLTALPAHNPCRAAFERPDCHWRNLLQACGIADLVTVTTPELAERFAPHGRVAVLPNCVPEAMLALPRSSDGQTLGWGGAQIVHRGDLEVSGAAVAEALERTGWGFKVIGEPDDVARSLGVDELRSTGRLPLEQWHCELGSLDVGIAPLADCIFNRAKSYLKPLEYAARGVPCVMSPTPAYEALAAQGIGVLAAPRTRNWRSALLALMRDEDNRRTFAEQGRATVAERLTYERNGWRWAEAWEQALSNSRRRHAVLA